MYVTVRRGETRQNFNVWVYRQAGQLSRGSGCTSVRTVWRCITTSCCHRMARSLPSAPVYAKLVGSSKPTLLTMVSGQLSATVASEAGTSGGGVFFDWGPDLGAYHAQSRPTPIVDDTIAPLAAALSILDGLIEPTALKRRPNEREGGSVHEQDTSSL